MPLSKEKFAEMDREYGLAKGASTPATQVEAQVKDQPMNWTGRLANMVSLGSAGAEIGGLIGNVPGAIMLGGAGAAFGANMEPSTSPGMDIGATLGTMLASRIPGGGALYNMLKGTGGVALGSTLGSLADQKGQVQNIPFGKIAIYSGLTGASLAMSEAVKAATQMGPTYTASQQLKATLGPEGDIPLTPVDALHEGGLRNALRYMTGGTDAIRHVAGEQTIAADKIMSKVVGHVMGNDALPAVEKGMKVQGALRTAVDDAAAAGLKATGKNLTDAELGKAFGLDPAETHHFFKAVDGDPEKFVDYFIPAQQSSVKGLLGLRATMKLLPEELQGKLGAAMIARLLDKGGAIQTTERGSLLSGAAFENALFGKFGKERLLITLGKERTEALETLAQIMKTADPIGKDLSKATAQTGPLQYLSNKMFFSIASGSIAGAYGQAQGDDLASRIGMGLAGGVGVGVGVVPLFTLVSKIMTNPDMTGKLLKLSQKDGKAAGALLRTLVSSTTPEERRAVEPSSTPATRYDGLFSR